MVFHALGQPVIPFTVVDEPRPVQHESQAVPSEQASPEPPKTGSLPTVALWSDNSSRDRSLESLLGTVPYLYPDLTL